MNFTSYSDFRTKFQQMFDGDDISQSDMSVTVLDLIIGLGERRIYRELRSSTLEASFSLSTLNNAITLPSDFMELRTAPYVATFRTAKFMPWEQLQDSINLQNTTLNASQTNHPVFYSFQADTMIFYPSLQDAVTVTGYYYKKFADISGGTLNALFTRHPDVFLYAALAESGPFIGDERTPTWEGKYLSLVRDANEEERRRITRGSKLQARAV